MHSKRASRQWSVAETMVMAGTVLALILVLAAAGLAGASVIRSAKVQALLAQPTVTIVVRPGDTLDSIARRYDQASYLPEARHTLRLINGKQTSRLTPGERIKVPLAWLEGQSFKEAAGR